MPLATHPNATYEFVLSTDSHLPKDKQPIFIFRYLSVLEWGEIAKLNDRFEKAKDAAEMMDLAAKVILKTLSGWRNMIAPSGKEIPYEPEKLKSMVTLQEITELMAAAVEQRPSFDDKKKLDSPSDSSTELSAKTAKG